MSKREELLAWAAERGCDVGALFEQRPDLFRALMQEPAVFRGDATLDGFVDRVQAVAAVAAADEAYESLFGATSGPRTMKEGMALGVLADEDEPRE